MPSEHLFNYFFAARQSVNDNQLQRTAEANE